MIKIAVIGTGYVGLVTAVCFAEKGFEVVCVDNDINKIDSLNKGIMPIYEESLEELCKKYAYTNKLIFTTDMEYAVKSCEVIFIAVGTPSLKNGETDLSYVTTVANDIGRFINGYKVVVNKSTVPVGTQKLVKNIIKNMSKSSDFDVVSNPEFLKEGDAIKDTLYPDRIVIGTDSNIASEIMEEVYNSFSAPIVFVAPETSEMIKYASNTFLALKVSYINEIANICELVGADVSDVALGMGYDKRIGNKFLNAGIGFGGACFPKDVLSILDTSSKMGYEFKIARSLLEINETQKLIPVEKLKKCMNNELNGKKIAVLGLSFKPNTDDLRGAPSVKIISELIKLGAKIKTYDPVAFNNAKKIIGDDVEYCNDLYSCVEGVNAIVIVTEWDEIKNIDLKKSAELVDEKFIIDGRNCINSNYAIEHGFKYFGIGKPEL